MLMVNKKLQHLRIGSNKIGDDGARHVAEGFQQNDTLKELELDYCNISVKGDHALCMHKWLHIQLSKLPSCITE